MPTASTPASNEVGFSQLPSTSPWAKPGGTPGDDPERDSGERDVERGGDRGECRREAGPEHDQDEDQPDVVGLPHRPDRVLDQLALPRTASRTAGDQIRSEEHTSELQSL